MIARLMVAALLVLPAAATTGLPQRSAHAEVAATAGGPDRWEIFPRRLPKFVAVRRTGGFLRTSQTVGIQTTGEWSYSDAYRPGAAMHGQLSRWQMRELSILLSDPGLEADLWWHPRPIGCADAFHYAVAVGWGYFGAGYTDCRDPSGPMAALVEAVIAFTPL